MGWKQFQGHRSSGSGKMVTPLTKKGTLQRGTWELQRERSEHNPERKGAAQNVSAKARKAPGRLFRLRSSSRSRDGLWRSLETTCPSPCSSASSGVRLQTLLSAQRLLWPGLALSLPDGFISHLPCVIQGSNYPTSLDVVLSQMP